MIVTEIKPVTRQKFQIELDGQPAFVLYKGELSRYHIQKDEELPEEIYEELVGQVLTKRAKLRAMHLLEKMDRTRAELKKKLEQSGYPTKAVEEALKYVESFHYIDDVRYAARYIEFQKSKKEKPDLKWNCCKREFRQKSLPEPWKKQRNRWMQKRRSVRCFRAREREKEPWKKKRNSGFMDFLCEKGSLLRKFCRFFVR